MNHNEARLLNERIAELVGQADSERLGVALQFAVLNLLALHGAADTERMLRVALINAINALGGT